MNGGLCLHCDCAVPDDHIEFRDVEATGRVILVVNCPHCHTVYEVDDQGKLVTET